MTLFNFVYDKYNFFFFFWKFSVLYEIILIYLLNYKMVIIIARMNDRGVFTDWCNFDEKYKQIVLLSSL